MNRTAAKAYSQAARRLRGDRGLNILCRRVDSAIQIELKGDVGFADLTSGGHVLDAGDGREFALERSGDGRCHCVGIRAGQRRLDANSRVLDLRQIADGQVEVAEKTEPGDGRDH